MLGVGALKWTASLCKDRCRYGMLLQDEHSLCCKAACVVQCSAVLCCAVLCCAVLCCAVLCSAVYVQCNAVLCYAVMQCIDLCCPEPHGKVGKQSRRCSIFFSIMTAMFAEACNTAQSTAQPVSECKTHKAYRTHSCTERSSLSYMKAG